MVLQVAKDESKDKEFSDVNLPLPVAGSTDNPTTDEEIPPLYVKKKSRELCKIFSMVLNALLIVAVVLLAIKLCTLKKELDDIKDRDEYEITAKQADERDSSLDLKGDISKAGHERIRELMEDKDNNKGWFRNDRVKFYVCFKTRGGNSYWPWS